jgi:DNA-binding NarL/FixJ family response regulator
VSQTIRLLIADDRPLVRDGLRGIFEASGEFEVAGEAATGRAGAPSAVPADSCGSRSGSSR